MPIAFSQSTSTSNNAAADLSKKFGAANTAGNCIVVGASWGAANSTGIKVSDTAGNSYVTAVTDGEATNSQSAGIWYALNIAASSVNTVTLTTTNSFNVLAIHEYSGVATTNASDGTSSQLPNDTNLSSGTITTTVAKDLLFGWVAITSGTPPTPSVKNSYTTRETDAASLPTNSADSIQGSAVAVDAKWVVASVASSVAQLLALKPSAAAAAASGAGYYVHRKHWSAVA